MARIHTHTTKELTDQGWVIVADHSYETDFVPMRADRGATKQAKSAGQVAEATAGGFGSQAQQAYGAVIPGLVQEAKGVGTGFTPQQQNNMLVRQQEAAGGGNAAITGEGRLAALRSRSAGGLAPALAEAARAKGRTLATGALDVANENARLQQQQKQFAQQQLAGLYGVDTSNQLRAMGLQNEDLAQQLAAGRQGWLQNVESGINAFKGGTRGPAAYV